MAGIIYGLLGLFMMFSPVISQNQIITMGNRNLSCEFWYLLMMLIEYIVIVITIFSFGNEEVQNENGRRCVAE